MKRRPARPDQERHPPGAHSVAPPAGGWAVEARGLCKWYGPVVALDGVDVHVRPGEIHGLLGPNGAGKTTLLSCILGLILPDDGTLRLLGRTREEARSGWLDGVGGFVESPAFYPYLTGSGNLAFLARLDGGHTLRRVDEALDLVGLAAVKGDKVRGYSLGMRQRLGLAAALLRQPRLLVLDEPANGMDPAGTHDLLASLVAVAAQGLAVVVSSHNMDHIERVCRSVTVLDRGRAVFAGGLDELRSRAPSPTWRLRTTDDQAALALAVGLGLRPSRIDGDLRVTAPEKLLDELVLGVARIGVGIRGLAVDSTPLESVFFALTGSDGASDSRRAQPPTFDPEEPA